MLLSINVPWGLQFSGGFKSWTSVSHLRGSVSIPTIAPRPPKLHSAQDISPRFLMKATLGSPEHP